MEFVVGRVLKNNIFLVFDGVKRESGGGSESAFTHWDEW